MVISHRHRYLFVELPRTGSSAISRELCELYDGQRILKKHATFRDFEKSASNDEKSYYVFSGIRNPLDKSVSLYYKYKTDHRGYNNAEIYKNSNVFVKWLTRRQFRYVQKNDASFSEFFRRFYRLPYDDWSSLDHRRMDFIIRFERMGEDFEAVLKNIDIPPKRPLPIRNKTGQRDDDFWSYYGQELHDRAQWVFGPYFRRWGYQFPEEWNHRASPTAEVLFVMAGIFRRVYWRHLRG